MGLAAHELEQLIPGAGEFDAVGHQLVEHLAKALAPPQAPGRLVAAVGEGFEQGRAAGAVAKHLDDRGAVLVDALLQPGVVGPHLPGGGQKLGGVLVAVPAVAAYLGEGRLFEGPQAAEQVLVGVAEAHGAGMEAKKL